MVYSMSDRAIRHVFVDGRCVLKDGRLVGIDERELVEKVRRLTRPFFCDAGT